MKDFIFLNDALLLLLERVVGNEVSVGLDALRSFCREGRWYPSKPKYLRIEREEDSLVVLVADVE